MRLRLLTPPTGEPIDLDEARVQCRVDGADDDARLTALIATAREQAETRTRRAIMACRYELSLDGFPEPSTARSGHEALRAVSIFLPHDPVRAVAAVTYLDSDGAEQTLAASEYVLIPGAPSRIAPAAGTCWPATLDQMGAVTISYDTGDITTFTTSPADDTITLAHWPALAADDPVVLSASGGDLPSPLTPNRIYYVASVESAGVYTLAAAPGGSALDITDAGTGTHYLGQSGPAGARGTLPPGVRAWMLLRIKDLYDHKGTVDRGRYAPTPLEFAGSLLDAATVPTL